MLTIYSNLRKHYKKSAIRKLRKNNKCPAIVYKNVEHSSIDIELNNNEIQRPEIINKLYKTNIINLVIDNQITITVKIQDIHYHHFKSIITHIDFIEI